MSGARCGDHRPGYRFAHPGYAGCRTGVPRRAIGASAAGAGPAADSAAETVLIADLVVGVPAAVGYPATTIGLGTFAFLGDRRARSTGVAGLRAGGINGEDGNNA